MSYQEPNIDLQRFAVENKMDEHKVQRTSCGSHFTMMIMFAM